jgi:hypothetical protein
MAPHSAPPPLAALEAWTPLETREHTDEQYEVHALFRVVLARLHAEQARDPPSVQKVDALQVFNQLHASATALREVLLSPDFGSNSAWDFLRAQKSGLQGAGRVATSLQ